MVDAVPDLATSLLAGKDVSADVMALAPDQKGLLVDALLQGTFPLPTDGARPLIDLCVTISTEINAPPRLYFSLVRRGFLDATSSPESAAADIVRAKGLLKELGADPEGSYPCSSPVGMAFSQIVWLDYLIGSGFQLEGRIDDAAVHFSAALEILTHVTTEGKPGESWYFERKGDSEAALRRFDDAAESYRKALTYPEESDPKKKMDLLRGLALALMGKGDFTGAEGALREAAASAAAAGEKEAQAMADLTLANLYSEYLNRYSDAIASAKDAAAVAVNPETKRVALNVMGAAYISLGLYTDALACGQEVVRELAGQWSHGESMAISMVAADLSMMGRHKEALSSYRQAMGISLKGNDVAQVCDMLAQISTERTLLGEFEGALSELDRSASIAAQLPDHNRSAKCCVLKANIYMYNLNSLDDAERWYNSALDQIASAGPNEVADPYQHVQALSGLSSAYLARGDYQGAMACLRDSLEICGQLEPLAGTRAQVLRSIADVYAAQKMTEGVESSEREAAAVYARLGLVRDEASTYRDLSNNLLTVGEYAKALEAIETASSIYDRGGFRDEALTTVGTRALILFNQGRWEEAGLAIERGLGAYGGEESDPTVSAACYAGLAAVARKKGDKEAMLQNLLRAAGLLDSIRARLASEDLKLGFQASEVTVYGAIVEAFREEGEAARSFEYAERSKSRVLVEDLRTADLRAPPVSDSLVGEEARLLDDLRASTHAGTGDRAREVEAKLRVVWNAMEASSTARETQEYLSLRRGDSMTSGQAEILVQGDGKRGIVEYYLLNKRLLIFVLSKETGGPRVFAVDVDRKTLEDLNKRLLAALEDSSNDSYVDLAREMGTYLLAPISDLVAGLDHLHLVPHGFLHGLPIHVLPLGGRSLIDGHTVSYSQSASILRFVVEKEISASGSLVIGDTSMDLPFARAEAIEIARLLGTQAVTGGDATKELVLASLPGKRNVSFSCHARFSSDEPLSSGIKMPGDQMLTARDWLTLKTSADLITLSACESAVSSEKPGDEMLGLVRSMTYAGARSIVASLWKVDDMATFVTMTRFYENVISRGLGKPEALKEAQLYLRDLRSLPGIDDLKVGSLPTGQACDFSHPYFWAPFVVMGAW